MCFVTKGNHLFPGKNIIIHQRDRYTVFRSQFAKMEPQENVVSPSAPLYKYVKIKMECDDLINQPSW